jgi:hypothetical protein
MGISPIVRAGSSRGVAGARFSGVRAMAMGNAQLSIWEYGNETKMAIG